MDQEQLKEQSYNYITYNLDLTNQLELINQVLENILNNTCYNLETNADKKNYNTLSTINLELNDIIKENKGE